jgi:aldehyde dehydrogenase (NAD+)
MLTKYYINGNWVTPVSKNQMQVINPANEEVIGSILLATKEDVDSAVQAAKTAFETYSRTIKSERLVLLNKVLEITKDRLGELAQAISTEMGAPITMALNQQADSAVGHLQGFIEALQTQPERGALANGRM